MQVIYWNVGGYIITNFTPNFDAVSPRLKGVVPTKAGEWLSNWGFKNFWFK
jgi:hypothetical protein